MKAWEIVGFAYDADIHCVDCAVARFGDRVLKDREIVVDSEGNEVHPVFACDENATTDYCGDCFEKLLD